MSQDRHESPNCSEQDFFENDGEANLSETLPCSLLNQTIPCNEPVPEVVSQVLLESWNPFAGEKKIGSMVGLLAQPMSVSQALSLIDSINASMSLPLRVINLDSSELGEQHAPEHSRRLLATLVTKLAEAQPIPVLVIVLKLSNNSCLVFQQQSWRSLLTTPFTPLPLAQNPRQGIHSTPQRKCETTNILWETEACHQTVFNWPDFQIQSCPQFVNKATKQQKAFLLSLIHTVLSELLPLPSIKSLINFLAASPKAFETQSSLWCELEKNQNLAVETLGEQFYKGLSSNHFVAEKLQGDSINLHILWVDYPGIWETEFPTYRLFSGKEPTIQLTLVQHQNGLTFRWLCSANSVDAEFADQVDFVLRKTLGIGEVPHPELSLARTLSPEWQKTNTTQAEPPPQNDSLAELFCKRVRKHPDKIALYFQNQHLSYAQLDSSICAIQAWLYSQGVRIETPVVLYGEPSMELVIGACAVLFSGATLIPMDPQHPEARIGQMLDQVQSRHFLVCGSEKPPAFRREGAVLELKKGVPQRIDCSVPKRTWSLDRCAYVMFTSGSTGLPKGVLGTERGLLSRLHFFWENLPFESGDFCCFKKSMSLIGSIPEILAPILGGCGLHIAHRLEASDPLFMLQFLKQKAISRVWGSPCLIKVLLDRLPAHSNPLPNLKMMVTSGELITDELVRLWYKRFPATQLLNVYGSTEVASDLTIHPLARSTCGSRNIGVAFPGSQGFVVNESGDLLGPSVRGHLWVSGPHLARGYLGQPGLTAQMFRPHPFSKIPGDRIFDTGDLASKTTSSRFFLWGRVDHQINVRGFRIEPMEIERILIGLPGVSEACVVLQQKHADPRLVAYLVPEPGVAPSLQHIRKHLKLVLPSHMIPNFFQIIDAIPKTSSGKRNRNPLQTRVLHQTTTRKWVKPTSNLELKIAALWSDVLDVEDIGKHDHFFECGGHSLLASKVLAKFRDHFNLELPIAFFFNYQTVAEQAVALKHFWPRQASARREIDQTLPNLIPITPEQRGIWLQHQLADDHQHLHLARSWNLHQTSISQVTQALQTLQNQHDTLRVHLVEDQNTPFMAMNDCPELPLQIADLTRVGHHYSTLEQLLTQCQQQSFQLNKPPWRCLVLKLGKAKLVVAVVFHHLIMDGWSLEVFQDNFYSQLGYKEQAKPDTPPSFREYANWRYLKMQHQSTETLRNYWKHHLFDLQIPKLPADFENPNPHDFRGECFEVAFPSNLQRKLDQWHHAHHFSAFHSCLAAFAVLLQNQTGQKDLALLTPFSNRHDHRLETCLGMFVQTLVLKLRLEDTQNFETLAQNIRKEFNNAISHHGLELAHTLRLGGVRPNEGSLPGLRLMFAYDRLPLEQTASPNASSQRHLPNQHVQFDLTLAVSHKGSQLKAKFLFRSAVFAQTTIARFARQFFTILDACLSTPNTRLSCISGLPLETQNRWYSSPNTAAKTFTPLHIQIFQAAELTPDKIAYIFGNTQVSYAWVKTQSLALAETLRQNGVKPGDLVPILATTNLWLPVAWLACMACGAVGLPIDASWPKAKLIASLKPYTMAISTLGKVPFKLPLVVLTPKLNGGKKLRFNVFWTQESLWPSYAMFTSGSTGLPKTVLISQEGIGNRLDWMDRAFSNQASPIVLQTTGAMFDSSIWELFWPLRLGGHSILTSESQNLQGRTIAKITAQRKVTMLDSVPSLFHHLMEDLDASSHMPATLILGSEDFPKALSQSISKQFPATKLWNLYGPTEATIGCIAHQISDSNQPKVPIGKAISGTQAFVLDTDLKPVPTGSTGELYLAGRCLSLGYWCQPTLTAASFVPNPFSSTQGARLYKTGDLAKRLANGALVFLGRIDHQMNVHGLRIEPGEIEAAIEKHPGVARVAVGLSQKGQLTGYVVPALASLKVSELRAWLQHALPASQVPQNIWLLETLPQNRAGKLDRNALKTIHFDQEPETYHAPRTPLEARLVVLFETVLKHQPIGVHDSFFEKGGHSLKAMRLMAKVNQKLKRTLSLRTLFDNPTPAQLAQHIHKTQAKPANQTRVPTVVQKLPLSSTQKRFWFLEKLTPHTARYHIRLAKRLGNISIQTLAKAMYAVQKRHPFLQAVMIHEPKESYWAFQQDHAPSLPVIDLSRLTPGFQLEVAENLRQQAANTPFNFDRQRLHRTLLLRLNPHNHHLVFACHHLISDGLSMSNWERDLCEVYDAHLKNKKPSLPKLSVQATQLLAWQQQVHSSIDKERLLDFWRQTLAPLEPLQLLGANRLESQTPGEAYQIKVAIDSNQTDQLKTQARVMGSTPFLWVLTLLKVLLAKFTQQDLICVGTPVADRALPGSEHVFGCFLNTLPVATKLKGNPSFSDAIKSVRESFLDCYSHQELPFETIVDALNLPRDLEISPIFQALLSWEHPSTPRPAQSLFHRDRNDELFTKTLAKYPITLAVKEKSHCFELEWLFEKRFFSQDLSRELSQHFLHLLDQVLVKPEQQIHYLPFISAEDMAPALLEKAPEPPSYLLTELFSWQARKSPDRIALVTDSQHLSYAQLAKSSESLSQELLALKLPPETVIASAIKDSAWRVVSMLAIMQAGHTFFVLDTHLPMARQQQLLIDSQTAAIVCDQEMPHELAGDLPLISCHKHQKNPSTKQLPLPKLHPNQLAYLVFTSGSTGKPKGIAASHHAIVSYINHTNYRYHLHGKDQLLGIATHTFDASYRDLFGALAVGAKLVLPQKDDLLDFGQMCRHLLRWRINVMYSGVPSFLRLLAAEAEQRGGNFSSLRLLINGGEKLYGKDILQYKRSFGQQLCVFNQYGLTETTVTVTSYCADNDQNSSRALPIGPSLAYARTYLLTPYLMPVPRQSKGQIYIASNAHTRCYWNLPALTAQRFIPDPFSKRPGARLFKTGDLARFSKTPHENMQLIGRSDHQVKIRGQRIEPGEIEACLRQHKAVAVCAVKYWEQPKPQLTAYLKVTQPDPSLPTTLRKFLQAKLPASMVPDQFIILKAFPRLPNKKINYQALPAPKPTHSSTSKSGHQNEHPLRMLVGSIWQWALGGGFPEDHHHFFHEGGHSLLAAQMISRLQKTLKLEIPLRFVFQFQTFAELLDAIEHFRSQPWSDQPVPLPEMSDSKAFQLSFGQDRIWFLEHLRPGTSSFNLPLIYQLENTSVQAIACCFRALLQRHPVLRTQILGSSTQPQAKLHPAENFQLHVLDLCNLAELEKHKRFQHLRACESRSPFQLNRGQLIRAKLVVFAKDQHYLLLTLHHIISDGWSVKLISAFLKQYLQKGVASTAHTEEKKTPIYYRWAAQQRQILQGAALTQKLDFWREKLKDTEPLRLSIHRNWDQPTHQRGGDFGFNIPFHQTQPLAEICHAHGCTLFMGLQAVFQWLLHLYSGQHSFCIGSPIANRNQEILEHELGLFVNTVALPAHINTDSSFLGLLEAVRQHTLDALMVSDLPFELLVQSMATQRQLAQSPLFQVMMVYHQQGRTSSQSAISPAPVQIRRLRHRSQSAKYDLTAHFQPWGNGLRASFVYDLDRFQDGDIRLFAKNFLWLLEWVGRFPSLALNSCEFYQQNSLLEVFPAKNRTPLQQRPNDLSTLIENSLARNADATAFSYNQQWFTFAAVARRRNAILAQLTQCDLLPGDVVGLALERSPDYLPAMLACLNLGLTVLPMDVQAPESHQRLILHHANPKRVLVHSLVTPQITRHIASQRALELELHPSLTPKTDTALRPKCFPGNLPAFVMYTSGTSGTPKAVVSTRENLVCRLESMLKAYPAKPCSVGLLKKAPYFIGFLTEAFDLFVQGRPVVMIPHKNDRDPFALATTINKHRITRLWTFPSQLTSIFSVIESRNIRLGSLKQCFTSGEALPGILHQKFQIHLPYSIHINSYGSTELASDVALYKLGPFEQDPVPIGKAMSGNQLYIGSPSGLRLGVNHLGELLIGGSHLATGYWNNPKQTAWKFRPNPFTKVPGSRLFHTGDIAFENSDGRIVFWGRGDDQLKIRGFRLEPQQINTLIRQVDGVMDCAVAAVKQAHGFHDLHAYLVTNGAMQASSIRHALLEKLPSYAIPTTFHFLKTIPRTQHGKLLTQLLPKQILSAGEHGLVQKPQSTIEELLSALWMKLLKLKTVNRHDNFFAIGGHSLLAAELNSQIEDIFHVRLPLSTLFKYQTLADLAQRIKILPHQKPLRPGSGVQTGQVEAISPSQKAWWLLDQVEGGTHYQLIRIYETSRLCWKSLRLAIEAILQRHEPLRTLFTLAKGSLELRDLATPFSISFINLSGLQNPQKAAMDLCDIEQQRPFHLEQEPGFRFFVQQLSPTRYRLVFHFHHMVIDAFSLHLLRIELTRFYQAISQKNAPSPAQLPLTYRHFAAWQKNSLKQTRARSLQFWQARLRQTPFLEFPLLPVPRSRSVDRGAELQFQLTADLTNQLQNLAIHQKVTLHMVLLASYRAVLQYLCQQQDFCIGIPVANRHHSATRSLIGPFVNTLPLRLQTPENPTFAHLLKEVRHEFLAVLDHQQLPLAEIVSDINPARRPNVHPLFQTLFVFFSGLPDIASEQEDTFKTLFGKRIQLQNPTTLFPINLYLSYDQQLLSGRLTYQLSHFSQHTAQVVLNQWFLLIKRIVNNPHQSLTDLLKCDIAQQQELQKYWGPKPETPAEPYLPELVQTALASQPDAIGISHQHQHISKAFLHQQSDYFAAILFENNLKPEQPVAICMRRGIERAVAILAVFKAGGMLVALSPQEPSNRLQKMLRNSNPTMIICDPGDQHLFSEHSAICLNVSLPQQARPKPLNVSKTLGLQAAYALFTSGSTGNPKLVVNTHLGLLNRLLEANRYAPTEETDVLLRKTPFIFDVSIWEFFWPIINNIPMVLMPDGYHKDPHEVAQTIEQRYVSLIHFVPTMLSFFLDYSNNHHLKSLRHCFFSGEPLPKEPCLQLGKICNAHLHNLYGPTEAAVDVSHVKLNTPMTKEPTLGKPLKGNQIAVLNRNFEQLPPGFIGDWYLMGVQLARGYFRQPSKTAQVFLPNPYATFPGERMYQSGDTGGYLENGELVFCGRKDGQLKRGGVRLELGEIETALKNCPQIRDAIVLPDVDPSTLLAFLLTQPSAKPIDNDSLRTHLAKELPFSMIPNQFICLQQWPRTASDKVDRKQLLSQIPKTKAAKHPKTPAQKQVAKLWEKVLGLTPKLEDDFFALGGNSLKIIHLAHLIKQTTQLQLPITSLFQATSVEAQAKLIEQGKTNLHSSITFKNSTRSGSLIALPGGDGLAFHYRHLFKALALKGCGVGLQILKPLEKGVQMQGIVDTFRSQILEMNLKPPFHLLGWSLGGNLAFALANDLHKNGFDIARLTMIDSFRIDLKSAPSINAILLSFLKSITGESEQHLAQLIPERLQNHSLGLVFKKLKETGLAQPWLPENELRILLENQILLAKATHRHSLESVSYPATLIQTKASLLKKWLHLFSGDTETHLIDADHNELLNPEHAKTLAAMIKV